MESSACLLRLRVSPVLQFTGLKPELSRLTALPLLPPPYPSSVLHLRSRSTLATVLNHAPFGPTRCRSFPPPQSAASTTGVSDGDGDYSLGLTNPDLAPTTPSQRTFTAWDMASLWVGLVVGVPSYYLAGSLVDLGMSWLQGVSTVVLANLLLVPVLVLTGAAGVRHGVPFPVLARASFGVHGAHVPAMLRALVGCGWFGIETWIGGQAIYHLLVLRGASPAAVAPAVVPWLGTTVPELACFGAFWVAQVVAVWNGIEGLREFEKLAAPVLVTMTAALLVWAYVTAGGFHRVLSLPSRLNTHAQFQAAFLPALTANVGFWATVALNIPDFTRYAKSQRSQVLGQLGLPLFMGLFTFAGLAITSATEPAFGRLIPDPVHLLALLCRSSLPLTLLAVSGISLATITTNVAANIVAPANALASLSPSVFTFRRGALVTALLGAVCQPWRLLQSSESFVYKWLVGYSALLGPVAGVVLADYYLVKGGRLDVPQLYSGKKSGRYYYSGGFNLVALAALVAGMAPLVPGFVAKVGLIPAGSVPAGLLLLFDGAWFAGLLGAGMVYWVLSSLFTGDGEKKD